MTGNPVFGPNRLKLGIFCTNGRGAAHTLVPEAGALSWPMSLETARIADRDGYEAVVPFARWKGHVRGQPQHPSGIVLDPFTWAAAIAQATERVGVFVTSHAPTVHPILAAKQLATIDIISGGRLGLNVVGGWNKPEFDMFGAPLKEHGQRYEHLAEWLELLERLWTEADEFDHHGRFFDVVGGFSKPTPLQMPHPPIMNAGGSDAGRHFACRHADMCFAFLKSADPAKIREEVDAYKRLAREQYHREVQVWGTGYVVQRDTVQEAEDYHRYYTVERQDVAAVDGWVEMQKEQTRIMPPAVLETFRARFAGGSGGFPLVGTAATIAERLEMLSACGVDGMLLTWVDYLDGMKRFGEGVLPRLEQASLRERSGR